MNEIPHKFNVGETVRFINSINKKYGIVVAQDRSYGWPTYQVNIDGEMWTLCESDLGK